MIKTVLFLLTSFVASFLSFSLSAQTIHGFRPYQPYVSVNLDRSLTVFGINSFLTSARSEYRDYIFESDGFGAIFQTEEQSKIPDIDIYLGFRNGGHLCTLIEVDYFLHENQFDWTEKKKIEQLQKTYGQYQTYDGQNQKFIATNMRDLIEPLPAKTLSPHIDKTVTAKIKTIYKWIKPNDDLFGRIFHSNLIKKFGEITEIVMGVSYPVTEGKSALIVHYKFQDQNICGDDDDE